MQRDRQGSSQDFRNGGGGGARITRARENFGTGSHAH